MSAAELFVDSGSKVEVRAGMIRVEIPSGDALLPLAFTPHAAEYLLRHLSQAIDEHHTSRSATVLPFPAKAKRKARSAGKVA